MPQNISYYVLYLTFFLLLGCTSSNEETSEKTNSQVKTVIYDYPEKITSKKTVMKFVGEGDTDARFFSRVTSIENYVNGKKHGNWTYYNNDGSINKVEKYNQGELIKWFA